MATKQRGKCFSAFSTQFLGVRGVPIGSFCPYVINIPPTMADFELLTWSLWATEVGRNTYSRLPPASTTHLQDITGSMSNYYKVSKHVLLFIYWFVLTQRYVYWFEREREREKHQCERETSMGFSHMCPDQGSNSQPRHVPWPGIECTTFWCTGRWCSNELSHAARIRLLLFLYLPPCRRQIILCITLI